jgi:hypothetical protein
MKGLNIRTVKLPQRAEKNRVRIIDVIEYALDRGYALVKVDPVNGLIRISKPGSDINLYSTTMTVTTEILHPKKGKSQLHRKNLSEKQIKMVIDNPRTHTGVGYYRKRK